MAEQLKTFLRIKDVKRAAGISRSQIYALEAAGKFPRRIPLGPRSVAWDSASIAQWQQERIEQREAVRGMT